MWIREKRGGGNQCGLGFLYVLGLFKGSFGLFNAYLLYLAYFYAKQKKNILKYLQKIK